MQTPGALFTDFYQLTMLSGYFHNQKQHQRSIYELFFRKIPVKGGYCITAGLEQALEYMESLHFTPQDIDYLAGLKLFPGAFLDWLKDFRFRGSAWAVPEGTAVFPNEPLLQIHATLPEAQLVESAVLNLLNFQTLVATKASRVCFAATGTEVLEFGMRRAQGPDGAMSASRGAYIGGCSATSNAEAGHLFNIPVRGTQAHAWIMSFPSELESFRAYAAAFPSTCMLLVDTYDTLLSGVPNAITVGHELAAQGHRLMGIRLDSGDLAELSRAARVMLDEAGLTEAKIVASNDLDEDLVETLRAQGSRIDIWGVGTQLVTCKDEPALGGVYKLVAIEEGDQFRPTLKISANPGKITSPGCKQIWRALDDNGHFLGDIIALESETAAPTRILDPLYAMPAQQLAGASYEKLLVPVMKDGVRLAPSPPLTQIRERARDQLSRLPQACRRLHNPQLYPVGLSPELFELRRRLLEESGVATVPPT